MVVQACHPIMCRLGHSGAGLRCQHVQVGARWCSLRCQHVRAGAQWCRPAMPACAGWDTVVQTWDPIMCMLEHSDADLRSQHVQAGARWCRPEIPACAGWGMVMQACDPIMCRLGQVQGQTQPGLHSEAQSQNSSITTKLVSDLQQSILPT